MRNNNLLILWLVIFIEKSLTFTHSENLTVTRGESVQFRCSLPANFSSKENIIQWKKFRFDDENLVLSINGKIPYIFEKFYQTNLTNQLSSFEINNVDQHDSTTYICQTFETQTILCQYNLIVLVKPEAPSLTIDNENIEEYQSVSLTCSSINGNPPAQYTWYRNNTLITPLNQQVISRENASIYMFNATRYDNHVKYECQIWNQALAIPLRIEQYIYVKYRPYVRILEEATTFTIDRNQITTIIGIEYQQKNLTCQYDANPLPTSIYWLINGTTIISREKYVHIPQLSFEQSGIYTCVVENSIGRGNQSIYLNVEYAPRVRAVESYVVANQSDTATLSCIYDANPLAYEIKWFKNNTEINRDNEFSDLRIRHVQRNDSGLYKCVVYNRFYTNQISNGSSLIELIVQSRPIIETTHSKIAAELDQSATLTCRVIGKPKPNIHWKHNDEIVQCNERIDDTCYLHISKMVKNDFGIYQCIAENLLGKEEWSYTIVSRGKPETPTNVIISNITATSFKIQFSPSFDGGSGSQEFFIEITDSINSTLINQQVPNYEYEHTVSGLNESTLYNVRMKSVNKYGESPWSNQISVETSELIITSDDLPQLHRVSYNSKEHILEFDYLPDNFQLNKSYDEYLCLNIRQSSNGELYHSIDQCLPILNHRVQWKIDKRFPYLKLSICSKKYQTICSTEIEMKEDFNGRFSIIMIFGVIILITFLIFLIVIIFGIIFCRSKRNQSNSNKTKFDITNLDKSVRPVISEPRLQNPYQLYSNSNIHLPRYEFSNGDYQQRKIASSFSHPCEFIDEQQFKEEFEYGQIPQPTINHSSPQSGRCESRSGSNPSSDSSCITQHTNILVYSNDIHTNGNSTFTSNYGFPSIGSALKNSLSIHPSSSSSENSTPNGTKKRFYEVVV